MTLILIALIVLALTAVGGGVTALNLHWKRTPFRPYIAKDPKKNRLTVNIAKREGAEWPAAAMEYRYESSYDRRYGHALSYAKIADIDASAEDADEQLVEAIVQAKGFCKDWREGDNLDQLSTRAQKLLKS